MSRWLGPVLDRAVVSLGVILSGLVLIAVSWLGVSGRAEVEEQLPWLLVGVGGLVVVVVGGALLAWRHVRASTGALTDLERDISRLHHVAIADGASDRGAAPATEVLVAPDGSSFHRPGCRLVDAKPGVVQLAPQDAIADGHRPCPLCEPLGDHSGS